MHNLGRIVQPRWVLAIALVGIVVLVVSICAVWSVPMIIGCLSLVFTAFGTGILYAVPKLQMEGMTDLPPKERMTLENECRKTIAQILGGVVLIAGLYFSWRTIRDTEQNLTQTMKQESDRLRQERHLSDREVQLRKQQRRVQAFSELTGHGSLITALHVNKLTADVNVQYEYNRWLKEGRPSSSVYLDDLKEQLHWSQQMVLDIARENQKTFETIGVVSSSFPSSAQLTLLVKQVSAMQEKEMEIQPPKPGLSDTELLKWRAKEYGRVHRFVNQQYDKPIDELLKYLELQIPYLELQIE